MGMLEDALREYAAFEDRSTDPSTPSAGEGLIYFKDGKIHSIDDAGTVVEYGAGGGGSFGSVQTYTPALTATTTNPDLGSGGSFAQEGFYIVNGNQCTVWVRLRFGDTSPDEGSGNYMVDLPVAPSDISSAGAGDAAQVIGWGRARDNSTDTNGFVFSVGLLNSGLVEFGMAMNSKVDETNRGRFTWAAGDVLSFQATYPVSS